MDVLLRSLAKLKSSGLELVHQLMEVYLIRTANEPLDERFQQLITQLFPPKKLLLADCIDGLVEFVTMIARTRLDFTMRTIIFELLKGESVIPDR